MREISGLKAFEITKSGLRMLAEEIMVKKKGDTVWLAIRTGDKWNNYIIPVDVFTPPLEIVKEVLEKP